jgi:hypothetical protein
VKHTPIAEIVRRIQPLALKHQAAHLRGHIASEQGYTNGKPNVHKTSVRIRELQAALQDVTTRRLRRENRAA